MKLLSMMIYFVLKYNSLEPLDSSGYLINIHSMLCGCKALLLSSEIRVHVVDPNTLKFDTFGLCLKYALKEYYLSHMSVEPCYEYMM